MKHIKISIFSNIVLMSETMRFLKSDHPTFYWVLNQFEFTGRDDHPVLSPKKLVPIPCCLCSYMDENIVVVLLFSLVLIIPKTPVIYSIKLLVFIFLDADVLALKRGHYCENHPALGLVF